MANTPPSLPKLAPEDMKWARWVTNRVAKLEDENERLRSGQETINRQTATVANEVGKVGASQGTITEPVSTVDYGYPQRATQPVLATERGTVSIYWDGRVNNMVNPYDGPGMPIVSPNPNFKHVIAERSDTIDGTYTQVGTALTTAGVITDVDVVVGNSYYYRFALDTYDDKVNPKSLSATIQVAGIDLGSLDEDLAQLLDDLGQTTTGGAMIYQSTPPGVDYQLADTLWFDSTDPNGVIPKRWDGSAWVAIPYGSGALGPGSVVASHIVSGAIDAGKIAANAVTADKIGAGAITAIKIGADAVTANSIAASAITGDKLAIGAVDAKHIKLTAAIPTAESTERVPRILTDAEYWGGVTTGSIALNDAGVGALATTAGIQLTATTLVPAQQYITANLPVPGSRTLHIKWSSTGLNARAEIRTRDIAGVASYAQPVNDQTFNLRADAVSYSVKMITQANSPAETVTSAEVFEVIGSSPTVGKQAAQLSPSGLQLFNTAGTLAVDLSTNTSNFFSIYNNGQSLATIDESGVGTFASLVSNTDISVQGLNLVGSFGDATVNGRAFEGALFDRLARGLIYSAGLGIDNTAELNVQSSASNQGLSVDTVYLEAGRRYRVLWDGTFIAGWASGTPTGTPQNQLWMETWISTSQTSMTSPSGIRLQQRILDQNTTNGTYPITSLPPTGFFSVPTSGLYYIQTKLWNPSNRAYAFAGTGTTGNLNNLGGEPRVMVEDVGPIAPDTYVGSRKNRLTAGTPAAPPAQPRPQQWGTAWSASFNNGGSSKVLGSGEYTDRYMLYQGVGASSMGSKVGFPDVTGTLSGRTINKVEVWLQNRWTYWNSGEEFYFASHNNTSEPGTFGGTTSGTFNVYFGRGEGKWIDVPNSVVPYDWWKTGNARGIALVVNGSNSHYGYFDGWGKPSSPQLRINYT